MSTRRLRFAWGAGLLSTLDPAAGMVRGTVAVMHDPASGHTPLLLEGNLGLEPLRVDHAVEMVAALAHPGLYVFMGGSPPSLEDLKWRYEMQANGSRRADEHWHNWIIRDEAGDAMGYVQASVEGAHADIAWVVGMPWQGHGVAQAATRAMCRWLRDEGVQLIEAHIHPEHFASARVAACCELKFTGVMDDDGEDVWRWTAQ